MINKKFACDLKQVEGSKRRLKFIASTSAPDRDLDEISVSGWQLDNYMRNPVVLLAHNYNSIPLARTISLNKDIYNDRLDAVIEFPEPNIYDVSDTVFNLAKAGFINAVSVGFRGLEFKNKPDGGRIYIKQELLEISIVAVPAQPQALQMAMSKGVISASQAKMLQDNYEFDLASIKMPKNYIFDLSSIEVPEDVKAKMEKEKKWSEELEKDMRR